MSLYSVKACPCGSGKPSQWQTDGRGIPLCRTCEDCHAQKMSQYNPVIFNHYTSNDLDAGEAVEPEDYY